MKLLNFTAGEGQPFFLLAGPCMAESEGLVLEVAAFLKETCDTLKIPYIFKASFDKANRTSVHGARGPGIENGLNMLAKVKSQVGVPVITDIHEDTPIDEVASVVDVLQTPAFLCRQTNFLERAAKSGKPLNIKKGQFLSPMEMKHVVEKVRHFGNPNVMVTERGFSFGYNNLITDIRSLIIMRDCKCPVVFDATHSVQMPGAANGASGGNREFIAPLARAAIAAGIDGLFMETHPNPEKALSDGPNSWPLHLMPELLKTLKALDAATKSHRMLETAV